MKQSCSVALPVFLTCRFSAEREAGTPSSTHLLLFQLALLNL